MRTAGRSWAPEETAVLREASLRRTPLCEIAAQLGRTAISVRAQARKLKIGIGKRRSYNAEERAQIRMLALRGKHYHEIAALMGMDVDNVKNWCLRNGVKVKPLNERWKREEKQLVAATVKETVDLLAARLNRSPRAVLHHFLRAGMLYTKIQKPIRKTRATEKRAA